jgi:hypothetical protein
VQARLDRIYAPGRIYHFTGRLCLVDVLVDVTGFDHLPI